MRLARRATAAWARAQGLGDVADDAALVVSELAANAVIHARTDFEVLLSALPGPRGGIRVEVSDGSPTMPLSDGVGKAAMSGRGLPLVHALATGWGVHASGAGKGVWAEVTTSTAPLNDATAESLLELWSSIGADAGAAAAPQASQMVRITLADLPVTELLAAKVHMQDLVRELQLVLLHRPDPGAAQSTEGGRGAPPAPGAGASLQLVEVARRLDAAARDFDVPRLQIRGQALRAVEAGRDQVTVDLSLSVVMLQVAVVYRDAIKDAETLSSQGLLLAHTEDMRRHSAIRRRYLGEIIAQLETAVRAEEAREEF